MLKEAIITPQTLQKGSPKHIFNIYKDNSKLQDKLLKTGRFGYDNKNLTNPKIKELPYGANKLHNSFKHEMSTIFVSFISMLAFKVSLICTHENS